MFSTSERYPTYLIRESSPISDRNRSSVYDPGNLFGSRHSPTMRNLADGAATACAIRMNRSIPLKSRICPTKLTTTSCGARPSSSRMSCASSKRVSTTELCTTDLGTDLGSEASAVKAETATIRLEYLTYGPGLSTTT